MSRLRRFFARGDFDSKAVATALVMGVLIPLVLFLVSRILPWDPLPWILLCWAIAGLFAGSALVLKVVEAALSRRDDERPSKTLAGPQQGECPHCGYSPLSRGAKTCPNCRLNL